MYPEMGQRALVTWMMSYLSQSKEQKKVMHARVEGHVMPPKVCVTVMIPMAINIHLRMDMGMPAQEEIAGR